MGTSRHTSLLAVVAAATVALSACGGTDGGNSVAGETFEQTDRMELRVTFDVPDDYGAHPLGKLGA